ncbi:integrase catalytic domain-containing protein [Enterococcus faecalis]
MDVTHIPKFDKQKFVHVTIDTISSFLHASLQSREASKHYIAHCIKCFAVMGTPNTIKTDNGPRYTGKNFQLFCTQLSISHKTGIPYNPQGQEIIEQTHQTHKHQLQKL